MGPHHHWLPTFRHGDLFALKHLGVDSFHQLKQTFWCGNNFALKHLVVGPHHHLMGRNLEKPFH